MSEAYDPRHGYEKTLAESHGFDKSWLQHDGKKYLNHDIEHGWRRWIKLPWLWMQTLQKIH